MLRGRLRVMLGLIFAIALVPSSALAQITTATVIGVVKDAQGGVVPGATVVLISEARGTRVAEATTDGSGGFVMPNVLPDTYTVQVTLTGFKTLKRAGIDVSPGDRLTLPTLTIEVGTLDEVVQVTGEAPLIQAASGERSFTIPTTSVENLPIQSRNFTSLALLTPGVTTGGTFGVQRIGGGGYGNIMMDGISAMDTGNNGQILAMNVDAIAEVKVLTSAYQAEYGRSSGIQVLSVTKSGTNRFRGSVYWVRRNSDWNANSWYNIQVGNPKSTSRQTDWGYTFGGPIGKPGGNNKLFFFYSHEYRPRSSGNSEQNFRLPTALERQGNFSQSLDNTGTLYNLIKDPLGSGTCTAANTSGCFQDGGVLGKIPADRLYQPGLNLLNMYPILPNITQAPGTNWNVHQFSPVLNTLSYQPAVRIDYQITGTLRVTGKYSGQNSNSGIRDTYSGYAIDGLYNTKGNQTPWIHTISGTVNYTLGAKTFLEATYGRTYNWLGTVFTSPLSNRYTAKLDGLPYIYPDATVLAPNLYEYKALSKQIAPFWVNGRAEMPQVIGSFGTRSGNTPGTPGYPAWLNTNQTWDFAASMTRVMGKHTAKAGVYMNHSYKAQNIQGTASPFGTIYFSEDTNNPYNTGFGYANIATGGYSSYSQAEKFIESGMVYTGVEPYIQDNWKVNSRLTLDYGLRFVHLQPEYDVNQQASQFFQDRWVAANAPQLYQSGCKDYKYPCSTSNNQALNPVTGQLMGAGTSGLIGQRVPGTGDSANGLVQQGKGITKYNFIYPWLKVAPRVGAAYLLRQDGKMILRGGFGLFFDRVEGNWTMTQSQNPPTSDSTTLYYGQLQNLGKGGPASAGVPTVVIYEYDPGGLPASSQWNIGTQMQLPQAFSLDVSYVGSHSYNMLGNLYRQNTTDLNMIDLGTAYLPQYQDPAKAASAVPGSTALTNNLLRYYRGYASIQQGWQHFWRTSHGLQVSLQRRFSRGFSAGLNWNYTPVDVGNYTVPQRIEHVNGKAQLRSDQKAYEELLKDQGTNVHIFRGTFVWDLPDAHPSGTAAKILAYIINDWQLSGVWTGQSGGKYSIGYSYQNFGSNTNLTGSPDYGARIVLLQTPDGKGCSSNQYKQFDTSIYAGPVYNSVGMESGSNYLTGCFTSIWDIAFARNIRLGGARNLQIRAEMYNAFNTATYTSRSSTMSMTDPVTQTLRYPQYLPDGSLNPDRLKPNNAGFGAATGTTGPRNFQVQIRFSF